MNDNILVHFIFLLYLLMFYFVQASIIIVLYICVVFIPWSW